LRGEGCFDGKEWERERRPASAEEPDGRYAITGVPLRSILNRARCQAAREEIDQPGTIAISEKRMCAQKPLQLDFYQVL